MTGADGARVANVDVSKMPVPRLMVAVGESRGESSLGVTGRGFLLRREKSVMHDSVSCVGLMDGEARESYPSRADRGAGLSFRSTGGSSLSVLMVAIVSRFVYMLMIELKEETLFAATGLKGERGGGWGGV